MSKYAMGYTGGGASGVSGFTPFAGSGYRANSSELFGLYGGLFGDLTSALGAYGQAKTAKINAQMQYAQERYSGERNYLVDLYGAKLEHQRSVQEAEMLSLQGQAQQAALAYQEAMSEINARRERANLQHQADMARTSGNSALIAKTAARHGGDHEAARYSLQAGNTKASQRAGLAVNNVVLDEGSALELQQSADLMRKIDMNTIRNNAVNEAFGYEARAGELFSQAAMSEANKHTVQGQYLGSAGVRTQYTPYADMSGFVTKQPVFDQSHTISPGMTLAPSLLGAAGNFHTRWNSIYNKKAI